MEKEEVSEIMNELTFAFEDSNNTQAVPLKRYFHRMDRFTVVQKIPFSSERKYRAIEFEEKGCYVLGAPEFLLQDDEEGAEILRKVNQYSEGRAIVSCCLENAVLFRRKMEVSVRCHRWD
ncbi:MAG: hypothetical protein ACLTTO_08805 [Lachnospiraceae bacterium]